MQTQPENRQITELPGREDIEDARSASSYGEEN